MKSNNVVYMVKMLRKNLIFFNKKFFFTWFYLFLMNAIKFKKLFSFNDQNNPLKWYI